MPVNQTSASVRNRAVRIMERCDLLARVSEEEGKITRTYGRPALRDARVLLDGWMRDAGMTTRVDNVGNLIGRYEAEKTVRQPKTIMLGGHWDSVRDAGRYDGTLGVLSGIAAVEGLQAAGRRLDLAVEVMAFVDEEGVRFHTAFLGSSRVAGSFDLSWLALTDDEGITLGHAIRAFGGKPEAVDEDARAPDELSGFVEVHIEQGPVLQDQGVPVAIVSGITGSARAEIEFTGMAGHAGTIPMPLRRDALPASAELILAVENIGRSVEGLVATVGKLDVEPGASNVVAGHTRQTLDLRHPDPGIRARVVNELKQAAREIGERRSIEATWHDAPGFEETPCDPDLSQILRDAIEAQGIAHVELFSGAGHDAVTMAAIAPVTMMFVRCKDGVSHNPAESITVDDVAIATAVLDRFLETLASGVSNGED